jgi:hypothetical protein
MSKPLLSTLKEITPETQFDVDPLPDIPDFPDEKVLNSTILRTYALGYAWITAKMIKTGFNTRKTTKKGVRRMTKSLKTQGYLMSNAVVVYPGEVVEDDDEDELTLQQYLTETDVENGIQFLCADGMHRVRCVRELAELKAQGASDIRCGDKVYAVILRPDTPKQYLIQLSLSK